jgi:hypothetical protein
MTGLAKGITIRPAVSAMRFEFLANHDHTQRDSWKLTVNSTQHLVRRLYDCLLLPRVVHRRDSRRRRPRDLVVHGGRDVFVLEEGVEGHGEVGFACEWV